MINVYLIERTKEAVIFLNGKRIKVTDIWYKGHKVWPLDKSPTIEKQSSGIFETIKKLLKNK